MSTSTSTQHTPSTLLHAYLTTISTHILPLTRRAITTGSKVFGAAILLRSSLGLVLAATNEESLCPLWHGETNCIRKFYEEIPAATRPSPKDCIFLTTHEPCSLCLSAITWAGFDNFTYLFTYGDTRDAFSIPHDINILQQVYRVRAEGESEEQFQRRELYNRRNDLFTATSVASLLAEVEESDERKRFETWIGEIEREYRELAGEYQKGKGSTATIALT